MKDINKTFNTGALMREPTHLVLSNGSPLILFTLACKETWLNGKGNEMSHSNQLDFEVLGKDLQWMQEHLKVGKRYLVEGFTRCDIINGNKKIRIRVFKIQPHESKKDGLDQALRIIENSIDLASAHKKIKLL